MFTVTSRRRGYHRHHVALPIKGIPLTVSTHLTALGADQEAQRLNRPELSGSEANRGDYLINLTTGRTGYMHHPKQDGRVAVDTANGAQLVWERWDCRILVKAR